jgi:hypothetical protein
MADVSKLKRRSLGAPPPIEEASPNLQAPEIAPLAATQAYHRKDARSARKTNRTLAFATRVSPEFDASLRNIAERDGLKLVELLERALKAYESKNQQDCS